MRIRLSISGFPVSTPKLTLSHPASRISFRVSTVHRIHPGKGAPGKPEPAPEDLVADLLHLPAVGDKEIVGHVDPVDAVGEDLLDLVDDERGGSQADPVSHHPASLAEDAGIGAAAAGDDADRIAEGLIARQREQMARGKRQGIEIFDERLGIRSSTIRPSRRKASPRISSHGRGIHLLGHQFGDGPLPFPASR